MATNVEQVIAVPGRQLLLGVPRGSYQVTVSYNEADRETVGRLGYASVVLDVGDAVSQGSIAGGSVWYEGRILRFPNLQRAGSLWFINQRPTDLPLEITTFILDR